MPHDVPPFRRPLCMSTSCHTTGGPQMSWYVSIGAVLVASAITASDVAGVGAPDMQHRREMRSADKALPVVDVELVLAVDVSYSMDMDELAVQREGYAQAIVSKEFLQALKSLPNGKVAITYFEWAASSDQKIIIPWRLIDGPETADAVSEEILKTPIRRASRTSISGAIYFAMPLFEQNPYHGLRRVIDISGDGRARYGAGQGHHHQRPADHGQGSLLFEHGYRESRFLLRGLRDRGAGV